MLLSSARRAAGRGRFGSTQKSLGLQRISPYWRRLGIELLEQRRLLAGPAVEGIDPVPNSHTAPLDTAVVAAFDQDTATTVDLVGGLDLVEGVSEIVAGTPSPVYAMSDAWSPIVAGDEDASFPSTLVLARGYGSGRVIIFGQSGTLTMTALLDNAVFIENVTRWLDVPNQRNVLYTTGHSEWVRAAHMDELAALLAPEGYTVSAVSSRITPDKLDAGSVLIVGNAWGDFTTGEIEVVRQFVEDGGGLWLVGVGWSWEPYHPGTTIEDYPMMHMAAPYEVRWLRPYISDPTDQFQGNDWPVFHTFYPDIRSESVSGAMAVIDAAHAANPTDLAAALEADADLRLSFTRAHQAISIPAAEFLLGHPQRQQVFDYYVGLATAYPDTYARVAPFDQNAQPTATWVRERFWRTWRDSVELTPAVKAQIVSAGQLTGRYADLFNDYGVILLDNLRLGTAEVDFIYRYLDSIPAGLHNLRAITVRGYLGSPVSLAGLPGAVNIFAMDIGDFQENPFPDDVSIRQADVFVSVVAHEVNHVVDAYTIGSSEPVWIILSSV